jgi:hypothetical protein
MEKRKIIYRDGKYEILKPITKGKTNEWFGVGTKKSIKGISDLLNKGGFEFYVEDGILQNLIAYHDYRKKQELKYGNLESKTI